MAHLRDINQIAEAKGHKLPPHKTVTGGNGPGGAVQRAGSATASVQGAPRAASRHSASAASAAPSPPR